MKPLDFRNKLLLKIMWTCDIESVVWNMKSEVNIRNDSDYVKNFSELFDLKAWSVNYYAKYKKWLDEDSKQIFDLEDDETKRLLTAIGKINRKNKDIVYFYWYDIDRSEKNVNFVWKKSPISGAPVLDIGTEYHPNNRLISIDDYLVFPL